VLYQGPPTTDVLRYGDEVVADLGVSFVVTADRHPCESDECDNPDLDVRFELELLPR